MPLGALALKSWSKYTTKGMSGQELKKTKSNLEIENEHIETKNKNTTKWNFERENRTACVIVSKQISMALVKGWKWILNIHTQNFLSWKSASHKINKTGLALKHPLQRVKNVSKAMANNMWHKFGQNINLPSNFNQAILNREKWQNLMAQNIFSWNCKGHIFFKKPLPILNENLYWSIIIVSKVSNMYTLVDS